MSSTDQAKNSEQDNNPAPANSSGNRAVKTAATVGSEISGITFIKRGLSANYRAITGGGSFLKRTFFSFKNAQKRNADEYISMNEIPLLVRQIMQANSLFTICLGLVALFVGFISLFSMSTGSLVNAFKTAFTQDWFAQPFAILLGAMAFLYLAGFTYTTFRDFKALSATTPAPSALSDQYHASFNVVMLIFLLHSCSSIVLQTAPDLSSLRTIAGIATFTLSISLFLTCRRVFDPSMKAVDPSSLLLCSFKSLLGFGVQRFNKSKSYYRSAPIFLMSLTLVIALSNFALKESSIVSIISLLVSILGLATLFAMFIHIWYLKHD